MQSRTRRSSIRQEGGDADKLGTTKEKIPLKQADIGPDVAQEDILSSHAGKEECCESDADFDSTLKPPNKVTLYIQCAKLINLDQLTETDPMVKLFIRDENKNEWIFDEETEVIPNTLEPKFTKALTINYYFEKTQSLKFEVYNANMGSLEFLGMVETTVAKIMASRGQKFKDKLMNIENKPPKRPLGVIIVQADSKSDNNNEVSISAHAEIKSIKGCCRDNDWPYLLIERARSVPSALKKKKSPKEGSQEDIEADFEEEKADDDDENKQDGEVNWEGLIDETMTGINCFDADMVPVYKSQNDPEHINDLSPRFKKFEQKLQVICNGDVEALLRFSVKKYDESKGHHLSYGFCTTTLKLLSENLDYKMELHDIKSLKPIKNSFLSFKDTSVTERPSFAEYLKGGWKINMSVAIDYTASNGKTTDPNSLHFISEKNETGWREYNQYEQAMDSVGNILETYAYRKRFSCYGFGGIPKFAGYKDVQHCFFLGKDEQTGEPKPEIDGLQQLLKAYRESLKGVDLYGPTFFKPVLEKIIENIKSRVKTLDVYHVILMLTDGCIHDMRETIDLIVAASELPLSIIIIGIGNADFKNMEILDADEFELTDSNKQKAKRDIVQFVKYNEFAHDIGILAENVLCEVPQQFVTYMIDNGKKPNVKSDEDKKPKDEGGQDGDDEQKNTTKKKKKKK